MSQQVTIGLLEAERAAALAALRLALPLLRDDRETFRSSVWNPVTRTVDEGTDVNLLRQYDTAIQAAEQCLGGRE